ncbi:MAG: pilus assembly protein [Lachnospiraceae bacterium]|nr:pilus assembly protein [Lachnospiraceae bacterium]
MKGYMTVEASLVLPAVFGVIMFVLSLLFFFYDRCLLEQEVTSLIVRSEYLEGESLEEKARNMKETVEDWYLEKYVWMDVRVPELLVKTNQVQVKAEGTFCGPFFDKAVVERGTMSLSPTFLLRQKVKLEKMEEKGKEENEHGIY